MLEPLTVLMSSALDDRVSHHFTRIAVQGITLQERHTRQFDVETMLAAARLLRDAAVDAILWNGTSGGWNGLEADSEICERITQELGVPASTTILALLDAMDRRGMRRYGLAVPYTDDVTARIVEVFGEAGLEATGVAGAGVSGGRDMAYVDADTVRDLLRRADSPEAECLVMACTGVAAAQVVREMEQELGKPVIDSVAVTLWKGLELVGIESRLVGWGALLAGWPSAVVPG